MWSGSMTSRPGAAKARWNVSVDHAMASISNNNPNLVVPIPIHADALFSVLVSAFVGYSPTPLEAFRKSIMNRVSRESRHERRPGR